MATTDKTQYDAVAEQYGTVEDLPCSKLEAELIRTALGDCAGLAVLDLGGGSGLHARRAVDAGAATVDVFDISPEMLRAGEEVEARLGRHGRIRWAVADATRPLAGQVEEGGCLRSGGYDIVMANWVFDHATTVAELRAMWENVVANLKPGGRFLGVRVQSVRAKYMTDGKYGATFSDIAEIPGGLRYKVGCLTQPPFSFEGTSMESTYSLADDVPRELGLVDFQVVPARESNLVRNDADFWSDFIKDPAFTVVTANKSDTT